VIRPLTRNDHSAILALFHASADYIRLERDEEPGPQLVEEFFSDAPPGQRPEDGHRSGIFDGETLLALAEMSFGFPTEGDSYLGLMMVREAARGQGLGRQLLCHLEDIARSKGAHRMFLAVFDANPRALSFWQRQGFLPTGVRGSVTNGAKTQGVVRLVKPL
jgi:GNAT superfamily N-acetyltransferase